MLSLKIGNTLVDMKDANIPVVLRSPVFTTDDGKIPGSFIFNFTIPYTDSLKKELHFANRPARKGKPTLTHPFDLRFGLLHYTGDANITEINDDSIILNMPVANGDLAAILADHSLKDLPISDIVPFDPAFSYGWVSSEYRYPAWPAGEPYSHIINLELKLIKDNFSAWDTETHKWTTPYDGTFNFKVLLNCYIFDYSSTTYPSGIFRYFRITKNGTTLFSELLIENFTNGIFNLTFDLILGDVIHIYILSGTNLGPNHGINVEYDICMQEGTSVFILDTSSERPFLNVINKSYPEINYAVFPIKNLNILSNVPESLFRVDLNDIKDHHQQFLNVANYYVNDEFPWTIFGYKNNIPYLLLNLFSPSVYVAYIISKLFSYISYTITNNVFESNELKRLVLFHNFIINNYFSDNSAIALIDFIPDVKLTDFIRHICSYLGIVFKSNTVTRSITFAFIHNIIADTTSIEFSNNVSSVFDLETEDFNGYLIKFTPAQCDFLQKNYKSLEGLTIKGQVDFTLPPQGEINDAWYVYFRRAWYVWQYDPDEGIYKWIFHSVDFPLELTDTDPANDTTPFTIEFPINTLAMGIQNNDPDSGSFDNTIGAPLNRSWRIPMLFQASNFAQLPQAYRSEAGSALLFYQGLHNDSRLETYPLGSNEVYNFAGGKITGADLSLRLDTEYGIYEKKWKAFIQWRLNSPGQYTFHKHMTVLEIADLDFFKWHKIYGVDYLLKEVRFNILTDRITVCEIIAHRR